MNKVERAVELFKKEPKSREERNEFRKLFINLKCEELKDFQLKIKLK